MNADPGAPVVRTPLTSTNPFDNKIYLRTKEGISVWKTSTEPDFSLDCIALTAENGDKLLARIKRKYYEFQLNEFIRIPTTGNGVPENLRGGPWNSFGEYRKILYNYHKLSEYQVTTLAWYYWVGNDTHCIKLDPLVTVPLDFTAVDPELQREKEKQQYCIRAEMIFQIMNNNVPRKISATNILPCVCISVYPICGSTFW